MLRATNNTLPSDWKGVCSDGVKQKIEQQLRDQAGILDVYVEFEQARNVDPQIDANGESDARFQELMDKIETMRSKLPATVVPDLGSYSVPAVSVRQFSKVAESSHHEGRLEIKVLRPVPFATGSGKLDPEMDEPPQLMAHLVESPINRERILVRTGTGTRFDFNIHLKLKDYGRLKPGTYVLQYEALAPSAIPPSTVEEEARPQRH